MNNQKNKVVVLTIWDRNEIHSLEQILCVHDLAYHFGDDIDNNRIIFINAYRKTILPPLQGFGKVKNEENIIQKLKKLPVTKNIVFSNAIYGEIESESFLKFIYALFKTKLLPITLVFNNGLCLGAFLLPVNVKNKEFGHFLQKAMDGTLNKRKNRKSIWKKIKRFFSF